MAWHGNGGVPLRGWRIPPREGYNDEVLQDETAQRRAYGQRWIIPLIVLVAGLLFWWDSSGDGYPPHVSHKRSLRLLSDASKIRAGEGSVDQFEDFIWQEAVSATADLQEPLEWSLSEDGLGRVFTVKGAKGGVVRVYFDDQSGAVKSVERGEQEQ